MVASEGTKVIGKIQENVHCYHNVISVRNEFFSSVLKGAASVRCTVLIGGPSSACVVACVRVCAGMVACGAAAL